jgi:hypothetical protein
MQIRATENTEEFGACGCGRSPTGKCIGWHSLTEEQYQVELEKYDLSLFDDDSEEDPL